MKAIIPAAGEGTRLRPHTYHVPKALLHVGGKPILGHIIDSVLNSGINDIAFIIGYKGDKIKEYVDKYYSGIKKNYFIQKEINGIAGAVILAGDYLDDDPVFIVLGDTIFETDLDKVFEENITSLGVKEVEDPKRFGIAELNSNGYVAKLIEKPENPSTNLALAGLYYVKQGKDLKSAIEKLIEQDRRTKNEFQITDSFQIMIEEGEQIKTFKLTGWYDCGKFDALLETNKTLLEGKKNTGNYNNSLIFDNVYISDGVFIENSMIKPYVSISHGSSINNSIIENSIIGENVSVNNAILKDSVIGNNAVITGESHSLNIGDNSKIDLK